MYYLLCIMYTYLYLIKTWILINVSTLAIIIFITSLVCLYYHWGTYLGLPLNDTGIGSSVPRKMGDTTMYIISILVQQGIVIFH